MAKYSIRNKFHIVKLNDKLHNKEACLKCRSSKVRKVISWSFPSPHVLVFHMNGVARGNLIRVEGEFFF